MATLTLYWFRNDLRLSDNPAFAQACRDADYLCPIVIHNPAHSGVTTWGFERIGQHRRQFKQESIDDLRSHLRRMGSDLYEFEGKPSDIVLYLQKTLGNLDVYCQQIEAPEERQEIQDIMALGVQVKTFWQSSMLDPMQLPFDLKAMPDVFTLFRKSVESIHLKYAKPIDVPNALPLLPKNIRALANGVSAALPSRSVMLGGGESRAQLHVQQYLDRRLPDTYKQTRNGLMGNDFSSKLSPWLALGCCSARWFVKQLDAYEQHHGANDGTYWLWFELLWRDYFQFLPFKYGHRLFHAQGLSNKPVPPFDPQRFHAWQTGQTPDALINAGMRELSESGFISNRMRQIVASYWIYDMAGDWRVGAAWFEANLIDYDVYSNQGNWLYIAGRGTDPRGGRPFNVAKQTLAHDPDGTYRKYWLG